MQSAEYMICTRLTFSDHRQMRRYSPGSSVTLALDLSSRNCQDNLPDRCWGNPVGLSRDINEQRSDLNVYWRLGWWHWRLRTKSIVGTDINNFMIQEEFGSVVFADARAAHVAATMEEHHHRQRLLEILQLWNHQQYQQFHWKTTANRRQSHILLTRSPVGVYTLTYRQSSLPSISISRR